MTFLDYLDAVHIELERLGIEVMVNAHLPPAEKTAEFLNTVISLCYAYDLSVADAAKMFMDNFTKVANLVHPPKH